jgi:hypothetical protein
MKRLFYSLIIGALVSTLALGAEVRKLGIDDLEWGIGSTTSPAGKVVRKIPIGIPDDNTFMGMVDVRAYGATGDGVTDDSAAIQAAIDVATATGKVVYLPAGRYKISTTLNMKESVRLEGSVRMQVDYRETGGTELVQNVAGTSLVSIADGVKGWSFKNLTFRGTEADDPYTTGGGTLVELNTTVEGLFEDCRFIASTYCITVMTDKNAGQVNINRCYFWYNSIALRLIGGMTDSFINNSEFYSINTGIYSTTGGLNDIHIYNNLFYVSKNGISATNAIGTNIAGNRFNDIGGAAIYMYGSPNTLQIVGNRFLNCGTDNALSNLQRGGIILYASGASDYADNTAITGNVFQNCYHDIFLVNDASPPRNSRITGNAGNVELSVTNLTHATASPVFFNNIIDNVVTLMSGKRVLYHSAAPTTGTWAVGDIVWNTGADNVVLWKNTVAGTPGTWASLSIP